MNPLQQKSPPSRPDRRAPVPVHHTRLPVILPQVVVNIRNRNVSGCGLLLLIFLGIVLALALAPLVYNRIHRAIDHPAPQEAPKP